MKWLKGFRDEQENIEDVKHGSFFHTKYIFKWVNSSDLMSLRMHKPNFTRSTFIGACDLVPFAFHLFPKVKSALKQTRFQTTQVVKEKQLTVENFLYCFEQ